MATCVSVRISNICSEWFRNVAAIKWTSETAAKLFGVKELIEGPGNLILLVFLGIGSYRVLTLAAMHLVLELSRKESCVLLFFSKL